MGEETIFTKIIKGDIPSHKVYEDELTIVFMPINSFGIISVLVVPKIQVDAFFDLPEKDYVALMDVVKKVAKRMDQVLDVKRIGVRIEGLEVPHVHVRVVAFNNAEEFDREVSIDDEGSAEWAKKLAF